MGKNPPEFNMNKMNMNQQLEVLCNSTARFIMELNEATASLNGDLEEMAEKLLSGGVAEPNTMQFLPPRRSIRFCIALEEAAPPPAPSDAIARQALVALMDGDSPPGGVAGGVFPM